MLESVTKGGVVDGCQINAKAKRSFMEREAPLNPLKRQKRRHFLKCAEKRPDMRKRRSMSLWVVAKQLGMWSISDPFYVEFLSILGIFMSYL